MRSSIKLSFLAAIGVALTAGGIAAAYNLITFHRYEGRVARVMSGDQRSVLMGRLIQARVKAAQELVQSSVESAEANDHFRKRLQAVSDDLKTLRKDESSAMLDEASEALSELLEGKVEQVDDLFVHYRNIKATAFNFYRQAWVNKWMSVARQTGLILSDLDNLPYSSAEKAVVSVSVKLQQAVGLVTHAALPQGTKLHLFGQIGALKALVVKYSETLLKAEALKTKRLEALKALESKLQKYNDAQGKDLIQFGNEAHSEVLKALASTMTFALFAFAWLAWSSRRLSARIRRIADAISRQMGAWVSAGGNLTAQGFAAPARPDSEFAGAYAALDQAMRRVGSLRKEDILVKRLLNVPFLLVSRTKQATFWNSALSILAKVRALEETGPMLYRNLIRFTDAQGRASDPIDKAFTENKEIVSLCLLRIGNDGIAVQVSCTPVAGGDDQPDYVMVHLRDLRDENRRFENELDRQLDWVKEAVQEIKSGRLPHSPATSLRKPAGECVGLLNAFALELQEKASVLAGQAETMSMRMEREAGLKKNVHGRMEQLQGELSELRGCLGEIKVQAESVAAGLGRLEARGRRIKTEYVDVRKKSGQLLSELKRSQDLVAQSIGLVSETEGVAKRARANERVIRGILEKSAMLNANNSILGSKRELTPSEVASVTENITQLLGQFERSYRFVEQSVDDIESSTAEISRRLRETLNTVVETAKSEQAILKTVADSDRFIDGAAKDAADFSSEVASLRSASSRLEAQLSMVESKIARLVQIGKASVDLQQQLEIGFKGMFAVSGGEHALPVKEQLAPCASIPSSHEMRTGST